MKNKVITIEKKGIKNLKKLLMKVQCMSREQALYVLKFYGEDNPEHSLDYLIKTNILFEVGSNGIGANPYVEYSYNNVLAIWVLIKFLSSIDLNNIYMTQEPSSLFFLMDNEMYEVVVVNEGREAQIAYALQYRAKTSPGINYITLMSKVPQLDTFHEEISQFEHVNTIFALSRGFDDSGTMMISIMQKG